MANSQIRGARALTLALASTALAGCAHPARQAEFAPVTAVRPPPTAMSRVDGYYQSAVFAIRSRDYSRALDLLQAARAANPDDVRILNAFGVVYDKLGRFDLSARYYAQASALDPKSPVVLANEAYSATLSRLQSANPPAPTETAMLQGAPASAPPANFPAQQTFRAAPAAPLGVASVEVLSAPTPQSAASAAPQIGALTILRTAPARLAATPLELQGAALPAASALADPAARRSAGAQKVASAVAPLAALIRPANHLAQAAVERDREVNAQPSSTSQLASAAGAPPGAPHAAAPTLPSRLILKQAVSWSPWDEPSDPARALPHPFSGAGSERVGVQATGRPSALKPATPQLARAAGRGLHIVDASGALRLAEPLRSSLASLGWSTPKSALPAPAVRTQTMIYYQPRHSATARALARTLPGLARLSACVCHGVELVLGVDVTRWRQSPAAHALPRAGA